MKQLAKRAAVWLSALLLAVAAAGALPGCARGTATISIVYTSDAHGHLAGGEEEIGIDVIAAIKRDTPGAILVDTGDYMAGLPLATLTQGEDVLALMKAAGYDAAALGNHEFSYGVPLLQQRAQQAAQGPAPLHMLAANVAAPGGGQALFKPWVALEVQGVKVGLFGLSTPETLAAVPAAVAAQMEVQNPVQAAQTAVAALREEGCKLVVALAHLGTDAGSAITSRDIAAQVPGIDVIIDGHSHVVLDEAPEGGPVLVSAGEYNRHVGVLALQVDRRSGEVLGIQNRLLDPAAAAAYAPDAQAAQLLAQTLAAQEEILGEVVAHSDVLLEGEKSVVRTRETNFGNLCADALVHATGADIGLVNAGNIRANLGPGDITRGDFLTALPYDELVLTKAVTGAQLADIIEHGLSGLPEAQGQFLQISGLRVLADAAAPAGSRLLALQTPDGRDVDPAAVYTVAVSEFIAGGGDGFPHFAALPALAYVDKMNTILLDYMAGPGAAPAQAGGRIVFGQAGALLPAA